MKPATKNVPARDNVQGNNKIDCSFCIYNTRDDTIHVKHTTNVALNIMKLVFFILNKFKLIIFVKEETT